MIVFAVYLSELWLFTAMLLILHHLRHNIGIIPLLFLIASLMTLLTLAPLINIHLVAMSGINLSVVGFIFVPLLLTAFLLIYISEGAAIAQVLLYGLLSIYLLGLIALVFVFIYNVLPSSHITMPEALNNADILTMSFLKRRFASLIGFTGSLLTIAISYQFFKNYFSALPEFLIVSSALMIALWIDTILFFLVAGFGFSQLFASFFEVLLNKTLTVISIMIPVSIYINRTFHRTYQSSNNSRPLLAILYGTVGNLMNLHNQLQIQLSKSQERYRQLAQQVVIAQEDERKHISRELHDEAGQSLTALRIALDTMLIVDDVDKLHENLGSLVSLVDDTSDNIRLLAHGLRPPELEILGLARTVEGLCNDWTEKTGIHLDCVVDKLPFIPDILSVAMYRILQEALTNIVRHANAQSAIVRLTHKERTLILSVQDDGDGFDVATLEAIKGIGIANMRERVELVDGTFEIQSMRNSGTHIIVKTPLRESA